MLWFVGKVYSELEDYIEAHSIAYGLFADAAHPPRNLHPARQVNLDFTDYATLTLQFKAHIDLDVDAVAVAGYENYVLPAALIARHFSVPGPSPEAAKKATDKFLMRQAFMEHTPHLTPDFAEVAEWDDIEQFIDTHAFPVMLKPANLMKSLLITRNSTMDELRQNYTALSSQTSGLYKKYGVNQPPRLIIESFLEGSMHTVAALADAHGEPVIIPGVVDCVTASDAGFQDNFLYSRTLPTRLSENQVESLYKAAAEGIKALGLSSCPAHVELILTDQGPKIIEIGARVGGYRPRMYEYGCGIDLTALMIDNAHDQKIAVPPVACRHITAIELFPVREGPFKDLASREIIDQLPSLRHLSVKPLKGHTVGPSSQGYKAAAVIILGNDDAEQFARDVAYVRQHAAIELD